MIGPQLDAHLKKLAAAPRPGTIWDVERLELRDWRDGIHTHRERERLGGGSVDAADGEGETFGGSHRLSLVARATEPPCCRCLLLAT